MVRARLSQVELDVVIVFVNQAHLEAGWMGRMDRFSNRKQPYILPLFGAMRRLAVEHAACHRPFRGKTRPVYTRDGLVEVSLHKTAVRLISNVKQAPILQSISQDEARRFC
jgi:hypothetical protein